MTGRIFYYIFALENFKRFCKMNVLSQNNVSLPSLSLKRELFKMDTEKNLRPYTMEEINEMLDQAEANFAAGRGIPGEEVFRELEEEFSEEDQTMKS